MHGQFCEAKPPLPRLCTCAQRHSADRVADQQYLVDNFPTHAIFRQRRPILWGVGAARGPSGATFIGHAQVGQIGGFDASVTTRCGWRGRLSLPDPARVAHVRWRRRWWFFWHLHRQRGQRCKRCGRCCGGDIELDEERPQSGLEFTWFVRMEPMARAGQFGKARRRKQHFDAVAVLGPHVVAVRAGQKQGRAIKPP